MTASGGSFPLPPACGFAHDSATPTCPFSVVCAVAAALHRRFSVLALQAP